MKRNMIIAAFAAIAVFASCQKSPVSKSGNEDGYLSFSGFVLGLDETVETKATAAGDSYTVIILDSEGMEYVRKTYSEVKNNDSKISLPAGNYTLVARSTAEEVPVAEFEQPVYGVSKAFSITAGEETAIGELTCTLLQVKVTVAYSDDFLANVTGAGSTKVEVTSGTSLEYALAADGTYNQSAGYFAVNEGKTMTVVFSGSYAGKNAKMTKTFANVAAKQWRQVKFIPKVDEEGQATFDIVINDLISDATLNNYISAAEDEIGTDPDAPKGDGGITLVPDYEAGCDAEITNLENILIAPLETREMAIRFRATVPNGVKKFTVDISSDSDAFLAAVDAAQARKLDLIYPLEENAMIFDVVPFPHGEELLGQTDIAFNLDAAQEALNGPTLKYVGTHTFAMNITDAAGCKKTIKVVMIVAE